MRRRRFHLLLLIPVLLAWTVQNARLADARSKPGPVTIRGVATGLGPGGFILRTTSRGTYAVITLPATQVTEKGKTGLIHLREGDHVGVRGFLTGRTLRAIRIRVYPTKPKPYTLRGVVASVNGSTIYVAVAGTTVRVGVTGRTRITRGRTPVSLSAVRPRELVRLRVENVSGTVTAVTVYVYVTRGVTRHVQLRGSIVSVSSSAIVVQVSGRRYSVALSGSTAIRLGLTPVAASALKPGQSVTVYACCQGQPLTATSIHIKKTAAARHTILLRGRISSISRGSIRLSTPGGTEVITLTPATLVDVGSSPAAASGLRQGDEVSVRAYRSGSALIAERVHVYASSRQIKHISGTVVAVSSSGLTFTARGTRYVARSGSRLQVTLSGKRVRLANLRPGDKVRVIGQVTAPGVVDATQIDATRRPPKVITVRGTVTRITGRLLVIVDATGSRHIVRLAGGVKPQLHGRVAPAGALFPGVHASARGNIVNGPLLASSLTLTVTSRTIHGRVTRASALILVVRVTSSRSITVDVPPGVVSHDGRVRVSPASIHSGAYVRVSGYVKTSTELRAVVISIEHPAVDVAATVVSVGTAITIRTSSGQRYQLRFLAASTIVSSQGQISLRTRDVSLGARVHVQGTIGSDGMIAVRMMTVRLASVTIRGTVTVLGSALLSIQTPTSLESIRVPPTVQVTQGSHALLLSDVVVGDDVTVYGYSLGTAVVLARKITVHRRLAGFDGTVASVTQDGFVLQTPGGDHLVILSDSTIVSGITLPVTVGLPVHVTGYLRGDGAILATRIRAGKKASKRTPTPTVPPG